MGDRVGGDSTTSSPVFSGRDRQRAGKQTRALVCIRPYCIRMARIRNGGALRARTAGAH